MPVHVLVVRPFSIAMMQGIGFYPNSRFRVVNPRFNGRNIVMMSFVVVQYD